MSRKGEYVSFLVRLWRDLEGEVTWVAQIEEIPTGQRHYFGSVEELAAYIRDRFGSAGGEDT